MTNMREHLLGPSYFYHRRLIEQSKSWSSVQIHSYQQERFQRMVSRYGDDITQKENYRQDVAKYTRWGVPLLTHTVRTGGTSGQPLRFKADTFARRQKERAYLFDIWSQVGYRPYDLRVAYRGEIHNSMAHFDSLENIWFVSPTSTLEPQLGTLRRWIQTLPPFFLHVHPSSLFTFIDLVGENFFRRLPVRGVIAGSEAFPAVQQARFEEEFGIRVAHWYGHSEYAVLAYHCRQCHGFHFYPTYGCAEFLSSETEGCQRIVATSFNRFGTQFIRYDTGDLAMATTGSCPTNNFPRVSMIAGRSQETFIDSSGRRRSLFGYVFGDEKSIVWDHIRDLQVVQERPGSLRILFVANAHASIDQVERYFERRIPMATLEFEQVPLIERTASGKRKYFVSAM